MSGKISGLVWDMDLPPAHKFVLQAYADHADHEGYGIRPSYDLIEWKTGYNRRHIMRIVSQLEKRGIMVLDMAGGVDRVHLTNEWHIDVDAAPKKAKRNRGGVTPESPATYGGMTLESPQSYNARELSKDNSLSNPNGSTKQVSESPKSEASQKVEQPTSTLATPSPFTPVARPPFPPSLPGFESPEPEPEPQNPSVAPAGYLWLISSDPGSAKHLGVKETSRPICKAKLLHRDLTDPGQHPACQECLRIANKPKRVRALSIRDKIGNAIAEGAYGMAKGSFMTVTQADLLIAEQFKGEKPTPEQGDKLIEEILKMYKWYPGKYPSMRKPTKAETIWNALTEWRKLQPKTPPPNMVMYIKPDDDYVAPHPVGYNGD